MSQERVLAYLGSRQGLVTLQEIVDGVGVSDASAINILVKLKRRKLIERPRPGHYAILDAGRQAVAEKRRIKSGPKGPHTGPREQSSRGKRDRIWAQIRRARRTTVPDLVQIVGGSASNVQKYLSALTKAGILSRLEHRAPGTAPTSPGYGRWLLVRDLGPATPIWRPHTACIYDPNAGKVIPLGDQP